MSHYNAPFEIHVHGDVPLRPEVTFAQLQDALKPLWKYLGAKSLAGRYTPGTFTNQIQKGFEEPRLLIVTDPRTDHQVRRWGPLASAAAARVQVVQAASPPLSQGRVRLAGQGAPAAP